MFGPIRSFACFIVLENVICSIERTTLAIYTVTSYTNRLLMPLFYTIWYIFVVIVAVSCSDQRSLRTNRKQPYDSSDKRFYRILRIELSTQTVQFVLFIMFRPKEMKATQRREKKGRLLITTNGVYKPACLWSLQFQYSTNSTRQCHDRAIPSCTNAFVN